MDNTPTRTIAEEEEEELLNPKLSENTSSTDMDDDEDDDSSTTSQHEQDGQLFRQLGQYLVAQMISVANHPSTLRTDSEENPQNDDEEEDDISQEEIDELILLEMSGVLPSLLGNTQSNADDDDGQEDSTKPFDLLPGMRYVAKYSSAFRKDGEEIIDSDEEKEEDQKPQNEEKEEEKKITQEEEDELILKQMTGVFTKLPLEITFDVLARLPIKTLAQSFRWVSKPWFKIITHHPGFAQLQHSKAIQIFSPCVSYFELRNKTFYLVDHEVFDQRGCETTVYHPQITGFGWAFVVVGACNGLICMQPDPDCYKPASYFIFNPITREYINLPKSPKYRFAPNTSAFACDPITNEHKVIRIMKTREVEIYTLGSGSSGWRSIADIPYRVTRARPAFVNGALHWSTFKDEEMAYSIAVFDVASEKFQDILPPPPCVPPNENHFSCKSKTVGVLGGCLSFIDSDFDVSNDVWVMKSYGDQASWLKQYVFIGDIRRFGFWKGAYEVVKFDNGELLLHDDDKNEYQHHYEKKLLQYYDPKKKAYKRIVTHGIPSGVSSLEPIIHMGNLISPKNVGTSTERCRRSCSTCPVRTLPQHSS